MTDCHPNEMAYGDFNSADPSRHLSIVRRFFFRTIESHSPMYHCANSYKRRNQIRPTCRPWPISSANRTEVRMREQTISNLTRLTSRVRLVNLVLTLLFNKSINNGQVRNILRDVNTHRGDKRKFLSDVLDTQNSVVVNYRHFRTQNWVSISLYGYVCEKRDVYKKNRKYPINVPKDFSWWSSARKIIISLAEIRNNCLIVIASAVHNDFMSVTVTVSALGYYLATVFCANLIECNCQCPFDYLDVMRFQLKNKKCHKLHRGLFFFFHWSKLYINTS